MSRNPYHTDEQVPTLRNSVLVFMDILGYSDMIGESEESGTQQEVLSKLHNALSKGREWLEENTLPQQQLRKFIKKDCFALKAFTDNIVIGWPIRDDAEYELGSAFSKLGIFQLQMVISGLFMRGAISVGDAYIDEIAVFGKALVEAHKGESSLARDPRIILTTSAVNAARDLKHYKEARHAPHTRDILQDSDGQWFLNYLDCILIAEKEQGPFYEEFLKHKTIVEQKLQQHRGNPSIWSKYAWVAGYHNYFSDLHSEYFNDDYKINVELFRASPALIV